MLRANDIARTGPNYGASMAAAAALAAGAAYFLDPRSGRRRRALMRDQANRLVHDTEDFVAKAGRDAAHRAQGLYEQSVSLFRGDTPDDRVLEARVRAELGRLTSHPGAIDVSASKGIVRLRGDILEHEVRRVLTGVRHVRGVEQVVNEMQTHDKPDHISSLQGGNEAKPLPRFEFLQENWAPAPRMLAGTAGAALLAGGLRRRSGSGMGLALLGAALLARSIVNRPIPRMLGIRTPPEDGVRVQKSIHVMADLEETYSVWRNPENFPRFMSHVLEVRRIGENRYRWRVDGPAGVPVEWESQVTADVPGELIAWHTAGHSVVQSTGLVQFEPSAYGGTHIHVRMSYRPPANLVGHTVARLFGRDPKHQLDQDLMRFKTYIETGRPPHDAAAARKWH